MDDDGPDFWQQQEQDEEAQWLQDEQAQREYTNWLDSLNTQTKEITWDVMQATQAAATSSKPPKEPTSRGASS